jgi:hypothetical protein
LGKTVENTREETLDSEEPMSSSMSPEVHKEADEAIPAYIEEFEKRAWKDMILLASSPLEQVSIKTDFKK